MKHHIWLVFRLPLIGVCVVLLFINCGEDNNPLVDNINVVGVLSYPSEAAGRVFVIRVDDNTVFGDGFIKSLHGTCGSGTEMNYSISDVPVGTFYVYAAVCVVSNCDEGPQIGDYLGFYGTGLSSPDEANATIPESGTVTLDITLSEIIEHDTEPPSTPTGLACSAPDETHVNLSWYASSDNTVIAGYVIYRDGDSMMTVLDTATTDSGLGCDTIYCYQVSAYDTAGNVSARSQQACCTTDQCPDTVPPSTPTGLVCNAVDETRINLSWQASTDDVEIAGYIVYRDGDSLKTVLDTVATDGGLSCDTLYCYHVSAVDAASNKSLPTDQVCCIIDSCLDTEPPGAPIVVCTGGEDRIHIYWTDPWDNVGVVGYRIYRDGWYWMDVTWCCVTDEGLSCGEVIEYEVAAYDAAGNMSARGGTHCKTDECDW